MVLKRYPRQFSPHGSLVQSSSSICSSEESRAEPYQPLLQYYALGRSLQLDNSCVRVTGNCMNRVGFYPIRILNSFINVFFLRQSKPINCLKQLQHKVTVIKILVVPLLLSLFIFYKKKLDKVKLDKLWKKIKVVITYFSYLKSSSLKA